MTTTVTFMLGAWAGTFIGNLIFNGGKIDGFSLGGVFALGSCLLVNWIMG